MSTILIDIERAKSRGRAEVYEALAKGPVLIRNGRRYWSVDREAWCRVKAEAGERATSRPAAPLRQTAKSPGPGDHRHDVIEERIGVRPSRGCKCEKMRRQMNEWGVDGCREHRDVIVAHMLDDAELVEGWRGWAMKLPGGRTIGRQQAAKMLDEALARAATTNGE